MKRAFVVSTRSWPSSKASRSASTRRSSFSRRGSSFCVQHPASSIELKPGCNCCSRSQKADSNCGRWISEAVTHAEPVAARAHADRFEADREKIERGLDQICEAYLTGLPAGVSAAIRYGLKSPGKRLRPLLLLFAYRAAGGNGDATLLACAPEIVHSYSLMHDDLPCMDDDDMRRGRPTVHKVYGSKVAILAGVAMIPLGVRVASSAARELGVPEKVGVAIIETLLEAAGSSGMIGGQERDLAGEGVALVLAEREAIHAAKTGDLIAGAPRMGALAAGGDDK